MCYRKPKISLSLLLASIVYFIAGCAFENMAPNCIASGKPKQHVNVILITVSSLRADHVGSLGYKRDTTPNLDAFGKENVLFRNFFASSGWTIPSHGSIFTSLYPGFHGATHVNKNLSGQHDTLAEILKNNGYYTAGFCCNPRLDEAHGFAQGFDIYDDYSVSMILNSLAFENSSSPDISRQRTNDLINHSAIRWLQNNTHAPFFLFVHYYDNHWDYLPTQPYDQLYDPGYTGPIDGTNIAREPLFSNRPDDKDLRHIIALYDGEIKQTDNDLGEMLRFLKDKGLYNNSIIIIAGDHGEQFYEHAHTSHHGVYEELIHVPLAISIPTTKTKLIDSIVSNVDILPTIMDYLQIQIPDNIQGKSLKPVIEGHVPSINDFIFAEYTGQAVPDVYTLRSARYKYYYEDGKSFAYDLLKDPNEQNKIFKNDFTDQINSLQAIFQQQILPQFPDE